MGFTFIEKIFGARRGSIVFRKPNLILTHDNTASVKKTFHKIGGNNVSDPNQLVIVLDHNAPPTDAKLANQHLSVREFVKTQGIDKFHDVGEGICHQLMSIYAKPGMIIVGSDSHTCTAGAFNALAVGIDRTEAAGLWKRGDTWFRVPESLKVSLFGELQSGVYAKDLSLWLIGMIGSAGANYMSIEFHGEGVKTLSVSDRMTLANLASEMGAKNAVFPADEALMGYLGDTASMGVWADHDAVYERELEVNLNEVVPLVAAPHQVDNVKAVAEVEGTELHQGLIGTCTNGRLEDIRIAAEILKNKKIANNFQLLVVPASKKIYLQALEEGLLTSLLKAGAIVLTASCGPCLGTGQGIPADGFTVISTANRNFKGRMGNPKAQIYLASPACVAESALAGAITDPRGGGHKEKFPYQNQNITFSKVNVDDNRRTNGVWDYSDIDSLNTDLMFAGNLTYQVLSSDGEMIRPHLFKGFDINFSKKVRAGDVIIAGENFGCGSSREHPAVGLAHVGIKAIIVKSVNRIFFRSSVNQGLPIIVLPDVVNIYSQGDIVSIDLNQGIVKVNYKVYKFSPLPSELIDIFAARNMVTSIKTN